MTARAIWLTVVSLALLASQPAAQGTSVPAQQSTLVFRAHAVRVNVDVVVTDGDDTPVVGLTKDDFTITENGKPQAITDFQYISIPVAHRTLDAAESVAPPPDVATNAMPSPNSRLWAIMVDDLHLIESDIVPLKRTLTDIVRALPPEDEVALTYIGHSNLSQNFTTDSGRLLKAIDHAREALGFGLDAYPTGANAKLVLPYARTTSDTIRNVASSLAGSGHLRRAIIYVGTMTTIDPYDPNPARGGGGPQFLLEELDPTFEQAKRSDVPIYTIDPRGPVLPEDAVRGGIGVINNESIRGAIRHHIVSQQEWLHDIAINTGGRAFTNNSNLAKAVQDLVAENGSFYELAYSPDPLVQDGKAHKFSVKVNKPGAHVRSREEYVAPGASATGSQLQENLNTAMSAGIDVSGLTLRASAAPIAAGPKGVETALTIEVWYPTPAGGSRRIDDTLGINVLALDPDAKVKASLAHAVHVAGTAPTDDDVPLLVDEAIELPSQPLTLRIGVASQALGRAGSVQMSVDVPKPSDDRLQIGGLALGVAGAQAPAMNASAVTPVLVPFQPAIGRTFAAADRLRVYGRVFWGSKDTNLAAIIMIRNVPASLQTLTLNALSTANNHYDAVLDATVALVGLAPGSYVLEISARLPNGKPVARDVPFVVK